MSFLKYYLIQLNYVGIAMKARLLCYTQASEYLPVYIKHVKIFH